MTAIVTERVTVLVSPEEKAAFEAKAKRLGLRSVGELVRRSVKDYRGASRRRLSGAKPVNGESIGDRKLEAELARRQPEVDALLMRLEDSTRRANRALDEADRALERTLARFASKAKR